MIIDLTTTSGKEHIYTDEMHVRVDPVTKRKNESMFQCVLEYNWTKHKFAPCSYDKAKAIKDFIVARLRSTYPEIDTVDIERKMGLDA